ncbi:MAG: hypothetical protein OEY89_18095 [Gammaproteobacteria bacterium]|nr:hypothetical protein [Gammaproteobacteria bacterium]
MDDTINETKYFYLQWRKTLSFLFIALFAVVFYYAASRHMLMHVILSIFNLVAAVGGIWFLSTIAITKDGLVLYRVNRLKWQDIISARKTSFLGLPYILLKRQNGFAWWLPLYFEGKGTIQETIISLAPDGNPLKESLVE